jgi:HlyD family secretion protein
MPSKMIRDTSGQDRPIETPRSRFPARIVGGVVGALALLMLSAWLFSGWRSSAVAANASRLRIAEVTQGTLLRDASVNGRVVAAISPTLYAPAPATVSLKVNAGDTVKKAQVLALLESPELQSALRREQSTYGELKSEISRQEVLAQKAKLKAASDADQAEIERAAAQRVYERIERAGVVGVIARNDFEKARDNLKSAEIRGKHATEAAKLETSDIDLQLRSRKEQLARQKLTLDEAKRRVEELSVKAPMDGVVGSLAVVDRTVVPANAPLMTLVDLSQLEVELEIPESYVQDLGLGMKSEIVAGDVKATGKIVAISPEVIRNQVLARVRFDGAQPAGLRQSQRVQARLLIDERKNVLLLPRGPFLEAHGGKHAYVMQDGFAVKKPIRIGGTSVSAVEIVEGVKAGERVVVAGSEEFENAPQVKVNE